jgi:colicin import membrane protein
VRLEQERQAEADRLAAEELRRQQNLDHRASVLAEIKAEFMLRGVDAVTARAVILAIVKGEIPHIKVEF